MRDKRIVKIYDAARNNSHIYDSNSLADLLDIPRKEMARIVNNYGHIRNTLKENEIKAGAGLFNRTMREMTRVKRKWS